MNEIEALKIRVLIQNTALTAILHASPNKAEIAGYLKPLSEMFLATLQQRNASDESIESAEASFGELLRLLSAETTHR